MASEKELSNALDDCLDRLAGGDLLEDCLADYPKMAGELRPLLATALAARKALAIEPAPQFRARVLHELNAAMDEAAARKRRPLFSLQGRWAVAVASLLLVLLMTGGSVAVAAGKSMPDSSLYPVKLAIEQVLLWLSPSADAKAQLYARMADNRVTEIVYLAQRGDTAQIETAAQRLDSYLANITRLASAATVAFDSSLLSSSDSAPVRDAESTEKLTAQPLNGELAELLRYYAVNHPAALRQALETAPAAVQQLLREVLATSEEGYQNALDAIER